MLRLLLVCAALLGALVLASCATLSQEQCEAGDWRAIGFNDGADGRPADRISSHAEACSEYGIAVDSALYQTGRAEGLGVYCRLGNAERQGRSGDRYYGVCEGELGVAFARVHAAAGEIYDRQAELNSLDSEIDAKLAELRGGNPTPEQVAALTRELTILQTERRMLELRLRSAEQHLSALRRQEEIRLAQTGIAY
ncbi:DUF2799 domain-containing protein [Pelagibacterium halotolerans]|uniref:ATPase involved in DNA repair n=1 Tax=Pelagibacterium halotolerans (strain DSM 22347 / JCM 15775 / CGMCC 1.7692 / B2) TaxID=1082931 RepID=G4RDW3_PELHB|nr:DUF2799 domain-containing protein [Pelagibacterium halotolerans]AEQ53875.1 ATPase involved in DNA repair [Pelagibacterium halotolerans B2]QJR19980.1 DUF2799 domain-containing protein [Pelagibacterium halotolerans]SEA45559.1 Protein of unknown function [Pelagibacterium halotolerans]